MWPNLQFSADLVTFTDVHFLCSGPTRDTFSFLLELSFRPYEGKRVLELLSYFCLFFFPSPAQQDIFHYFNNLGQNVFLKFNS